MVANGAAVRMLKSRWRLKTSPNRRTPKWRHTWSKTPRHRRKKSEQKIPAVISSTTNSLQTVFGGAIRTVHLRSLDLALGKDLFELREPGEDRIVSHHQKRRRRIREEPWSDWKGGANRRQSKWRTETTTRMDKTLTSSPHRRHLPRRTTTKKHQISQPQDANSHPRKIWWLPERCRPTPYWLTAEREGPRGKGENRNRRRRRPQRRVRGVTTANSAIGRWLRPPRCTITGGPTAA